MGIVPKSSTLVRRYAEGGYKDVDIESQLKSLKIIWIRRLLDGKFHVWKANLNWLFLDTGVNAAFHGNFFNLPHNAVTRFRCILFSINN